jgi:hypothetical protein
METGLLLNVFTSLLIAGVGLSAAIAAFHQPKRNLSDLAFAGFWFLTAFSWLFMGTSMFLGKYNHLHWGLAVDQYFSETTNFLSMIAISYYATYRLFKNRRLATIVFSSVFIVVACCLFFVYQPGGVTIAHSSYFAIEYKTGDIPWQIFEILFAIFEIALLFDVLRNLYFKLKKSSLYQPRYLIAGLAVIVYGVVCYFEEQGYSPYWNDLAVWIMLALRITVIISAQIAFLAYSHKKI